MNMNLQSLERDPVIEQLIRRELEEDIGGGDVTSETLVDETAEARAVILAKGDAVLSGLGVAERVFQLLDPGVAAQRLAADGEPMVPGRRVLELKGRARSLLAAERTALNFLQRMSGIATLTRQFIRHTAAHKVQILDTRKTTPGLRRLEKYAVLCGGGTNHRYGLNDRILIKDNHRQFWTAPGGRSLADAVRTARQRFPDRVLEIEVDSEAELAEVLPACPDWVLLDNMTPAALKHCVKLAAGRCKLEASGGVTLDTVAAIAATGVDAVSIGALTHSAPAADFSLEFES